MLNGESSTWSASESPERILLRNLFLAPNSDIPIESETLKQSTLHCRAWYKICNTGEVDDRPRFALTPVRNDTLDDLRWSKKFV